MILKKKQYDEILFNITQMKSEIRYCRNNLDLLNKDYMQDTDYINFVKKNLSDLVYLIRNNKIKTMKKVLERLNDLL